MNKIGLQLYTVRNSMNDSDSIRQTLDAVKKAGYDEVQLYGSLELSEETGTIAKDIGLDVLGTTGSFDEFIENYKQGNISHYAIVLKDNNKVIGNIGFNNIKPTDKEGEIILKKYSPIGELSAFARQYADGWDCWGNEV